MEKHLGECDYADSECTICGTKFEKREELIVHQKTYPGCLQTPGKCYYFKYCHFESDNLTDLNAHMEDNFHEHLEALVAPGHERENVSTKFKDMIAFREKAGPSSMDVDHAQSQSISFTHPYDNHKEQCQQKSLSIDAAVPDTESKRENQEYGICESPILKSTSSLMANALEGSSSEDAEYAQYQSNSFMTDDFNERPKFINAAKLKKDYGCAICKDVVVQPHQTPRGNRVCKKCIEKKFVIKCPLPHDDMDEEELKKQQCQQEGLVRDAVVPDYISRKFLLKEKCFCKNQEYGCCENPTWKKLQEHQAICVFVPDRCPNQGCYKLFAKKDLQRHTAECEFGTVKCNFCQQSFKRKDMEEHLGECNYALSNRLRNAVIYKKMLEELLLGDLAIEQNALQRAGLCYYCSFQTKDSDELKRHMKDKLKYHIKVFEEDVNNLENALDNKPVLKFNDFIKKPKAVQKKTKGSSRPIRKRKSDSANLPHRPSNGAVGSFHGLV